MYLHAQVLPVLFALVAPAFARHDNWLWTKDTCKVGNVTDALCCDDKHCGGFTSAQSCASDYTCLWDDAKNKCFESRDRKNNVCCKSDISQQCHFILQGLCPPHFQVKTGCCDVKYTKFGSMLQVTQEDHVCCSTPCEQAYANRCQVPNACPPEARTLGSTSYFSPNINFGFNSKIQSHLVPTQGYVIPYSGFEKNPAHLPHDGTSKEKAKEVTVDDLVDSMIQALTIDTKEGYRQDPHSSSTLPTGHQFGPYGGYGHHYGGYGSPYGGLGHSYGGGYGNSYGGGYGGIGGHGGIHSSGYGGHQYGVYGSSPYGGYGGYSSGHQHGVYGSSPYGGYGGHSRGHQYGLYGSSPYGGYGGYSGNHGSYRGYDGQYGNQYGGSGRRQGSPYSGGYDRYDNRGYGGYNSNDNYDSDWDDWEDDDKSSAKQESGDGGQSGGDSYESRPKRSDDRYNSDDGYGDYGYNSRYGSSGYGGSQYGGGYNDYNRGGYGANYRSHGNRYGYGGGHQDPRYGGSNRYGHGYGGGYGYGGGHGYGYSPYGYGSTYGSGSSDSYGREEETYIGPGGYGYQTKTKPNYYGYGPSTYKRPIYPVHNQYPTTQAHTSAHPTKPIHGATSYGVPTHSAY